MTTSNSKLLYSRSRPSFFSLWRGQKLGFLEWLSIKSFIDYGYNYSLYTFDQSLQVPKGVDVLDASTICSENSLDAFRYVGSETGSRYAAGSDYFRYCGIQTTGNCWVDTDIVCLSSEIVFETDLLLAKEDESRYNVAFFGARGSARDLVSRLISECNAQRGKEILPWGALSPLLITRVITEEYAGLVPHCQSTARVYPLHWSDAELAFEPGAFVELTLSTRRSYTIHLWNEVLTRSGRRYCKPPVGSFVHQLLLKHKVDSLFVGDSFVSA